MRRLLQRIFRAVLYVALAVILTLNVWALITGNYFAVLSVAIDVVVVVSVWLGKPWAYIAVRVWACVLVIAGAFMWLAVLLGGLAYFHSFTHAAIETAMFILGLYFFAYSKPVLRQIGQPI